VPSLAFGALVLWAASSDAASTADRAGVKAVGVAYLGLGLFIAVLGLLVGLGFRTAWFIALVWQSLVCIVVCVAMAVLWPHRVIEGAVTFLWFYWVGNALWSGEARAVFAPLRTRRQEEPEVEAPTPISSLFMWPAQSETGSGDTV
jgi:hypothetical protein